MGDSPLAAARGQRGLVWMPAWASGGGHPIPQENGQAVQCCDPNGPAAITYVVNMLCRRGTLAPTQGDYVHAANHLRESATEN